MFVRKFDSDDSSLRCEGRLGVDEHANVCPRGSKSSLETLEGLKQLHLDHEYDLRLVCTTWNGRLNQRHWAGEMSPKLLLWLLFGGIEFRCFNGTISESCHSVDLAHYKRTLEDLPKLKPRTVKATSILHVDGGH